MHTSPLFTSSKLAVSMTFTMKQDGIRWIQLRLRLSWLDPGVQAYFHAREMIMQNGSVSVLDENRDTLQTPVPFPTVPGETAMVTIAWHCSETLATLWTITGSGRTVVAESRAIASFQPPVPCMIELTGECVEIHEFRMCQPLPDLSEWQAQTAAMDAKWAALYV
jgi:hypothetical protein